MSQERVLAAIREAVAEDGGFPMEEFGPDTRMFDVTYGGESIEVVSLLFEIEDKLGLPPIRDRGLAQTIFPRGMDTTVEEAAEAISRYAVGGVL